ncbi:MAG: HDIG domain-containing protein [Anaerolineae bacterium]|jgi:cyclic-di-AMP phosphodiesterase PgpH|nr:HDIG domain-containing protein [Anaerolineae bacterium]MBT7069732.1 HDIG domain-containing protein [Anaerolineae bacterium]MBT7326746.1 HDIG domain-containing protein [Anaerolineae bacterium]
MPDSGGNSPAPPKRFVFLRAFVLILAGLAAFATLVMPLALRPDALPLDVGEVAPRDLQAPRTIEYISEVRTEEARQAAALTVAPVYSTADPSIAREQIESLRETLLFIFTVRADQYASAIQKKNDLQALSAIQLEEATLETILNLGDTQWETIQQETLSVLEQVMRNSIRQGDVASIQRSVPSRVSLALTETQAQVVAELAQAFIVPNSLYSAELTETARASASEAVASMPQRYIAGETVVPSGEVISAADLEALTVLGLIQPDPEWPDYLGAGALALTLAVFLWFYFGYRRAAFVNDMRSLILVAFVFLIFLVGARLTIPNHAIIPYLYPLPAFGLLIAALFGVDAAFVLSLALTLLTTYGLSDSLDLTAYYLISSFISILVLRKARRVWSFIRSGLTISAVGVAMLLAYWLPFTQTDWIGIATLCGAAAFNGIASASLTLLLQFFIAQTLGLTTTLQLLEISRPDVPLLQFFLRAAPGTYQHSLQVSNLAEQAAESIGADALLVRVGALYHDVGKAENPLFFIENQSPGNINTHEDLVPEESAKFIIAHVTDGVALAKRYRLPSRLVDFMLEHHGTNITRYQYSQALQNANGDPGKVDIEKFRYPGPAPRSRETALLMLADGTEAISRAQRPQTETELRTLVQKVIDSAQQNGQLHNTRLTLRDLHLISQSFVATLRGTLHPRVEYPASASSGIPTKPNLK